IQSSRRRVDLTRFRRCIDRDAVGRHLRDDDCARFERHDGEERQQDNDLEEPPQHDPAARAFHASPLRKRPATMPISGCSSSTPSSLAAKTYNAIPPRTAAPTWAVWPPTVPTFT